MRDAPDLFRQLAKLLLYAVLVEPVEPLIELADGLHGVAEAGHNPIAGSEQLSEVELNLIGLRFWPWPWQRRGRRADDMVLRVNGLRLRLR